MPRGCLPAAQVSPSLRMNIVEERMSHAASVPQRDALGCVGIMNQQVERHEGGTLSPCRSYAIDVQTREARSSRARYDPERSKRVSRSARPREPREKPYPAEGVAHVSFPFGAFWLPVRTPYDRQLLIEHVAHRVRADHQHQVQVLVSNRRWFVCLRRGPYVEHCCVCGSVPNLTCHDAASDPIAYCIECAMGGGDEQRSD